jgi:hypothetical protein
MTDPVTKPQEKNWLSRQWDTVKGEWNAVTGWVSGKKDAVVQGVTHTIDHVTAAAGDAKQRVEDNIDDARHPVYSAIEMGLTAIFGKQAMKWLVDTLLGFFGKSGNNNVQSFGSGSFTDTLTRWQRELNRDPATPPPPQAKPAPT